MEENRKPIHVIINPLSGYGGQKLLLTELRKELFSAKLDAVEHVTRGPGDATRLARNIAPRASAIIAWGGDGTVSEIAQGLLGSSTPMLCVKAGTENLLAKELHIPRNPAALLDLLILNNTMEFDVGMINERAFHSIIGVGFDAEVVRRVAAERTGHISHLSYFWPIWRTFWEHDFPEISVMADGENVFCGQGLVFVGNISRYSSGLRICSRACFNDGELDLVIYPCNRQGSLIRHAALTIMRRHLLQEDVLYRRVKKIWIETEKPLTCEVDGDVGPITPLEISVSPDKIRLIVPARRENLISWLIRKSNILKG